MATRELSIRTARAIPDSLNETDRTIDFVIATGARTRVGDYRYGAIEEELDTKGMEAADSVPMLDGHSGRGASDVRGSWRNFRSSELPDGTPAIVATAHFDADDEEAMRAFRKYAAGHARDVSVGYDPVEFEDIPAGESRTINGRVVKADRLRVRVTNRWRLREVSTVAIGADRHATARGDDPEMRHEPQEHAMDRDTTAAPESGTERAAPDTATTQDNPQTETARTAPSPDLIAAERSRAAALQDLAAHGATSDQIRGWVSDGTTAERAALDLLNSRRSQTPTAGAAPSVPAAIVRDDGSRRTADVLSATIMLRAGLPVEKIPAPRGVVGDQARQHRERIASMTEDYSDSSLVDICRAGLRQCGIDPDPSRHEMLRQVFAVVNRETGDPTSRRSATSVGTMTGIFTNAFGAALQAAYDETEDSTIGWVAESEMPDYKINDRPRLASAGALELRARGSEAAHEAWSDVNEQYRIAEYAKQSVIDEQDIIDDRLGAFTQAPRMHGEAARRLRPDLVYSILLANDTLQQDGIALFDATDHLNLLTGGTSALGAPAMEAAIALMRSQRENGAVLNLMPRYLIVPQDLWGTAVRVTGSMELRGTLADDGVLNAIQSLGIQPRMDARLGVAGTVDPSTVPPTVRAGSATGWYLATAGGRGGIEVAYLRGRSRSPVLRTSVLTQGRWGIAIDVQHSIGAKALDFRGLVASAGV